MPVKTIRLTKSDGLPCYWMCGPSPIFSYTELKKFFDVPNHVKEITISFHKKPKSYRFKAQIGGGPNYWDDLKVVGVERRSAWYVQPMAEICKKAGGTVYVQVKAEGEICPHPPTTEKP